MRESLLLLSLAASLPVAVVPAHGQRTTDGLIVLYEFDEGDGNVVGDSGPGEPVDLLIEDPGQVVWGDGFLTVEFPTIIQGDVAPKLYSALAESNELTIEAWIRPALTDQSGPARILAYSDPVSDLCNIMIGQDGGEYQSRLRTSTTGPKGRPRRLRTADAAVVGQLTSLVYVFDAASGMAAFYVDGEKRSLELAGNFVDGDVGGNFNDPGNQHNGWDETYTFGLANEDGGLNRAFLGDYHLLAIYDRALSVEEIERHFEAGPELEPPGATRFVRGDVDANGSINLTDGIVVLNFLFLGAAAPACLDAADTDDDGGERPTLTDAVIIFSWLFSGGRAPSPPSPDTPSYAAGQCGEDAGDDMMDCATTPMKCDA